jgi:hypothetical protein
VRRARDYPLTVAVGCQFPVLDEDAERTRSLRVHATDPRQGRRLRGFDSRGVEVVPARR